MNMTYQQIIQMLTETNRKKYLIVDFLIGRGFIISPIIMILVLSLLNYFMDSDLFPAIFYVYSFVLTVLYGIVVSLIVLLVENKNLKNFAESDKERKLKKLKVIVYINDTLMLSTFGATIIIYNSIKDLSNNELNLMATILTLLISLILFFLISLWFHKNNFKKIKEEILRKGLLDI